MLDRQSNHLHVLGVRITAISFVSYKHKIDFFKASAMSAYLIEFIRRHRAVKFISKLPSACALWQDSRGSSDDRLQDSGIQAHYVK